MIRRALVSLLLALGTVCTNASVPLISAGSVLGSDRLDELVGWYAMDDGTYRMLTWAAAGGLILNDFASRRRQQLLPVSDDAFKMVGEDGFEYEVHFHRNEVGEIKRFSWMDRHGLEHAAYRRPGYGYDQREVRYRNGDTELVGLLLKPLHHGSLPAVVMIHGSGVADRDDFWSLHQADFLARRGVAVLLPDKRGCGKSAGSWESASFDEFADDALAGVSLLQEIDQIDPGRIGVMGLTQGGWIAPLAAIRSSNVRFVVNVSGSAATPDEEIRHEISSDIRRYGTPDFLVPLIAFAFERRAKRRHEAWWEKNGDFDPVEHWEKLTQPALVVYGSIDERDNVPVHRSVARLEGAREESGNRDFTLHIFPDTGQKMHDPETGRVRSEYLDLLVSWIHSRAA